MRSPREIRIGRIGREELLERPENAWPIQPPTKRAAACVAGAG